MTSHDFDLLVLGGGSAGFAAAIKGAELGARVALVEGATIGGTCVNVGCIPSKTLLRAAEANHQRKHHGFAGIPATDGRLDWEAVRAQKDALVAALRQAKYLDVLRSYEPIDLFRDHGVLAADRSVRLAGGTILRAGKVVVATGSAPWAPPIPGLAEAGYLDNASAMALERLPVSLAVIGGSTVGLELAQMFSRLGTRVTVLEAQRRILPAEDPAIGEALGGFLRSEGLGIHTGIELDRVDREGDGYTVAFREGSDLRLLQAEQVLVATGRRANTAGYGLEAVGVALGRKGEIVVNDYLETPSAGVYAAGDVLGDPMFVYVAAYGGTVAAENALTDNRRRYDLAAVPRVTFTDPAAASVGLSENEARKAGMEPAVAHLPMEHVPRAQVSRDTRGFVRLVAGGPSQAVIGAQILGAEAGEMIAEAALAIRHRLTVADLAGAFHPYLTWSEGLKLAAQSFTREVSTLSCCAG